MGSFLILRIFLIGLLRWHLLLLVYISKFGIFKFNVSAGSLATENNVRGCSDYRNIIWGVLFVLAFNATILIKLESSIGACFFSSYRQGSLWANAENILPTFAADFVSFFTFFRLTGRSWKVCLCGQLFSWDFSLTKFSKLEFCDHFNVLIFPTKEKKKTSSKENN